MVLEFDGGKGDNFSLELGSGQFIPGFEDQLVGKRLVRQLRLMLLSQKITNLLILQAKMQHS